VNGRLFKGYTGHGIVTSVLAGQMFIPTIYGI